MDDVLNRPGPHVTERIDDLLASLESLDDEVCAKLERSGTDEAKRRYEVELAPRLEAVRKLAARRSPLAKNALEDTIVLLREFHITAMASVVAPTSSDDDVS